MTITERTEILCNWSSHYFPEEELEFSDKDLDWHFCREHWARHMLDIGTSVAQAKMGPMQSMFFDLMLMGKVRR